MDIVKEMNNLAAYVNKDIGRGFTAKTLPGSSVRVEFRDSEQSFDVVLVPDSAYNVFIFDMCQIGMNEVPAVFRAKAQIGYLTLKLAEYNVKLNKRLSK